MKNENTLISPLALVSLIAFMGLRTMPVEAHNTGTHAFDEGLTLSVGLATTLRTGTDPLPTPWQIPGKLMGGEAEIPESGFTLDDASIETVFRHRSGVIAGGELSSHHDATLSLEQAWMGYQTDVGTGLNGASLIAGRMNALFSPEINRHASSSAFSAPRLLDNSLYGGHFNDTGVRGQVFTGNWQLGAEFWQGESFPATPGQEGGSQDAFAYWTSPATSTQWVIGGWWLHSRADQRTDDRLTSGHTHGVLSATTTEATIFDGGEQHVGLHAEVIFQTSSTVSGRLATEFIYAEVEGTLRDTTHSAELKGDYRGFWIQPDLIWSGNQSFAVRYERLVLRNHISGAGASTLGHTSGLINPGEDPESLGISYRYYPIISQSETDFWHQLGVRLEWTRVDAGIKDDYVGIGLVFRAQDTFRVD